MQYIKIIKLLFLVLALSLVSVVVFYYVNNQKKLKEEEILNLKKKDLTLYIRENNELAKQAREAYLLKDYKKTLELSLKMFKDAKSNDEKAFAEFSIAKSYFDLYDYDDGVKVFVSIFKNIDYDRYTRVAAMNTVMQQYKGSPNSIRSYLERDVPDVKDLSDYNLKLFVYQQMYTIQPTVHSSVFLGIDTLSKLDKSKKEEASAVFYKYASQINSDIKIQQDGAGSSYLVPNLIAAKATLFIFAYEKFGLSSVDEISGLLETSIKGAQENLNPITEQFSMLTYINFLAANNNKEKAMQVFRIFSEQATTPMVFSYLRSSDLSKEYPGIYMLYKNDKGVKLFIDKIKQ